MCVGVHKSDVVIVLATKGVLTRPWCLLEMWEAAVNQVPVVLFPVIGGGWTPDDARTLLSDLMEQMQARNRYLGLLQPCRERCGGRGGDQGRHG